MNKKLSIYADFSLLLTAVIWGGGFVAVKDALDSVTPFYITGLRFAVAALIMIVIFMKRVFKITKESIKLGSLSGILLFAGYAVQTIGLKYTTAGKQAFLTTVYVVLVPFFAWIFLKKRLDKYSVGSAILAFIGIGILTLNERFSIGFGDFLTLICAVFFGLQIMSMERFAREEDPILITIVQAVVASALSLFCGLFFEPTLAQLTTKSWGAILYLGIFSTCIAFLIQNVAQKYTTSDHAALILSLESVFGSIFAVIFLGEIFSTRMLIGCSIIFIAIIIAETKLEFLGKLKINCNQEEVYD